MGKLTFDRESGVQLADVPNAGVGRRDTNAKSGNPVHDVRSGKFGSGSKKPQVKTPQAPANVDPVEYARMFDAVRDAAREFDDPDEGDIREFISGRANSPETVDIAGFLTQVIEQRKADLVDLLDQAMRSSGKMKRGRRKIKLSAPRGYVRKLVRGLDENQLGEVMHRLEAMGHDAEDVERFFEGRVDNAEAAKSKRDGLKASDQTGWKGAEGGFIGSVGDQEEDTVPILLHEGEAHLFGDVAAKIAGEIARNLPNTEVHVHLPDGSVVKPESGNLPENTLKES